MRAYSKYDKVRIQNRRHRSLYLLLSFLIPGIVVTLALIGLHILPFGDKHSLAITDAQWYLNGQMSMARLLRGEKNLLYSLNGLGGNRWSSLAWGGFAPASLLALFATLETIPSWFTWMCVLNISLCGISMYMLLDGLKGPKLSHLLFSTCYALIGFNVVNCYQTGFFHGVQLLPIVFLGLVKLLREESPLMYVLSLGACVFLNFYFGFHLCVISAVLFFTYLYTYRTELNGKRKKILLRWSVSSVIAGLLGAPMWLPALKAYSGGGRLNQTGLKEYTFSENMPFIQMFSKFFSGANSTNELIIGLPNIFCGILVIALVILFFIDKKNEIRFKKAAAIMLTFYLISFYIPAFTLLMHGGTHTNWFPYRYSYVFSFLLILIAEAEFENLDEITLADTKRCGTVLLISVLLIFSTSYEFVSGGAVLLDLTLLLIMWLGFYLYKTKPDTTSKEALTLFLLLVVCGNLYANFFMSTKKVQDLELDLEEYRKNILVSGALTEALRNVDQTFFRMEKDKSESGSVGNDANLYDYYGVSRSGPTIRMFIHKGLCKLGINWWDMRHWYSEGVPAATDTLLGLKYLLSERDLTEEKGYEKKGGIEETDIYLNPNHLNVSVLSEGVIQSIELGDNVFENLNQVWRAMTGNEEDVFSLLNNITFKAHNALASQPVNSKELIDFYEDKDKKEEDEDLKGTYIEYSFTAEKDGPVYAVDTSAPSSPNGLATPFIKYCGYYKTGDTVTGHFDSISDAYITDYILRGYCANIAFATADNDILKKYADLLNSREITFNVIHENELNGSFTAQAGQRILFTIPWDEGWTCYIDGQKVPIDKTWDLFMSVETPEGHHTYEMKFFPAWMNYGLMLCGAALVGLVILMVVWKKRNAADEVILQVTEEKPAEEKELIMEGSV